MKHKFFGSKIALFLNGELSFFNKKDFFNCYEKIFVTDGAYNYIKDMDLYPDFIIGDLDSIDNNFLKKKNIKIIYIEDQNITDFEKALKFIFFNKFLNIDIWGASGKEQDHFLGHLSIASKYKNKLSLIFHDNYYNYFFADKINRFYNVKNRKISLFPFPKVNGLTTKGLKYSIYNDSLEIGHKIGIRNLAIKNTIEITYSEGILIIFIEK